jgi:hypothetical protein
MGRTGFVMITMGWLGLRWSRLDPVRFMAKVGSMSSVGRFIGRREFFRGGGRAVSLTANFRGY